MKADIHRIITHFFNVELNPFIAKYKKEKVMGTYQTGGLKQFKEIERHEFNQYATWLFEYRKNLFYKIPLEDTVIDLDELRKYLTPLSKFFVDLSLINETCPNQELKDNLLKPLSQFFRRIDDFTDSDYFERYVKSRRAKAPKLNIRVKNFYYFPLYDIELDVRYSSVFRFKENSQISVDGKFVRKTNSEGTIEIKMPEGEYRLLLGKYNKTKRLNVSQNTEASFSVFDFSKLIGSIKKKISELGTTNSD